MPVTAVTTNTDATPLLGHALPGPPPALLISPYGGTLVDLVVADPAERADLARRAAAAVPVRLSRRSVCDVELLATGGFSPLTTFMDEADYRAVLQTMRLASGVLYPIPITLPVPDSIEIRRGGDLALADAHGEILGLLTVAEIFESDRGEEARQVCGTLDPRHPLVREMSAWAGRSVSGRLQMLTLPERQGFCDLRRTPAATRAALATLGRGSVVAFQTRNPMHRVHEELTKRAAQRVDATLLIHPVVGETKPGDIDVGLRVRCCEVLVARYYDLSRTLLSLLPLAMRMAGPREALWHATIRRNYGATHMIVGRDHAGAGLDSAGRPFHPPYAAQELVRQHEAETGVAAVAFEELVYLPDEQRYVGRSQASGRRFVAISGTDVRERYLGTRQSLPAWFTRPDVAALLSGVNVARTRPGFCLWLMGLSGAGKSTIAEALAARLRAIDLAPRILDGDAVRSTISRDLGFSRQDRDANVLRIGSMAADLIHQGQVVICAVITPYAAPRASVRLTIGDDRFVLIHVDAPLELCERRDVKGLYARARRGEIAGLTGVDDPFEAPDDADLRVDTSAGSPDDAAGRIMAHLSAIGLVGERTAIAPPASEDVPP